MPDRVANVPGMVTMGEKRYYLTFNRRVIHSYDLFRPRSLRACQWTAISDSDKLMLIDAAIARLDTEDKSNLVRQARAILVEGRDRTLGMQYHRLNE